MKACTSKLYYFNNSIIEEVSKREAISHSPLSSSYKFINEDVNATQKTKYGYGIHIVPQSTMDCGTVSFDSHDFSIEFWIYISNVQQLVGDSYPYFFSLYKSSGSEVISLLPNDINPESSFDLYYYYDDGVRQELTLESDTAKYKELINVILQYDSTSHKLWYVLNSKVVGYIPTQSITGEWNIYLGQDQFTDSDLVNLGQRSTADFVISDLRIMHYKELYSFHTDYNDPSSVYLPYEAFGSVSKPYYLTDNMKPEFIRLVATLTHLYDACGNIWDAGDVKTALGGKFNKYCIDITGSTQGARLLSDYTDNTVCLNWSISCWIKVSEYGQSIISFSHPDNNAGSTYVLRSSAEAITLNEWTHLALVSNNGTQTMYINGQKVSMTTNQIPVLDISSIKIGASRAEVSVNKSCLIDDFYMTRSVLWTSDFTPPEKPFTYAPNLYGSKYNMKCALAFNDEDNPDLVLQESYMRALVPTQQIISAPAGLSTDAGISIQFDLSKEWSVAFELKTLESSTNSSAVLVFLNDDIQDSIILVNEYGNGSPSSSMETFPLPVVGWHKYLIYANPITEYIYIFRDGYMTSMISIKELEASSIDRILIGTNMGTRSTGTEIEQVARIRNLSLVGCTLSDSHKNLLSYYKNWENTSQHIQFSDAVTGSISIEDYDIDDYYNMDISRDNAIYNKAIQFQLGNGYIMLNQAFLLGEDDFSINCWYTIEQNSSEYATVFSLIHDKYNMMNLMITPNFLGESIIDWSLKFILTVNGIIYVFTPFTQFTMNTGTKQFYTMINYIKETKTFSIQLDAGATYEPINTKTIEFPINTAYSLLFGAGYDRVFLKQGNFKGNIDQFNLVLGNKPFVFRPLRIY